jgi:hypothetical protein
MRFLAACARRNIHPSVVGQSVQIVAQPLAAKPFGQLEEQLPGVSPFAGSHWFPRAARLAPVTIVTVCPAVSLVVWC